MVTEQHHAHCLGRSNWLAIELGMKMVNTLGFRTHGASRAKILEGILQAEELW
jgi:hypothetical protein